MDSFTIETSLAACRLLREGEQSTGKQGLHNVGGVSAQSVGARAIHMQIVTIPPGGRAHVHMHATHETAIYVLSGAPNVWHGRDLEDHSVMQPGDFFYIPADVPHLPYNPSTTETVVAVIARTDPNEQESVVLLPELERIHPG
jgi:uncharacterized RmlC-like cupin family protein